MLRGISSFWTMFLAAWTLIPRNAFSIICLGKTDCCADWKLLYSSPPLPVRAQTLLRDSLLDITLLGNSALTFSVAKRLPYADHVISLGTDGKVVEQGNFKQLDAAGGYVSNFNLPPPDWAYIPLHGNSTDQHSGSTQTDAETTKLTDLEEDDASRRMGDLSIYLYYIQSIGWIPTIIFVVAITVYIFCVSFPSKSLVPLVHSILQDSLLT